MELRNEIRTCEYEDVRVMWELLRRKGDCLGQYSQLTPPPPRSSPQLWSVFRWAAQAPRRLCSSFWGCPFSPLLVARWLQRRPREGKEITEKSASPETLHALFSSMSCSGRIVDKPPRSWSTCSSLSTRHQNKHSSCKHHITATLNATTMVHKIYKPTFVAVNYFKHPVIADQCDGFASISFNRGLCVWKNSGNLIIHLIMGKKEKPEFFLFL